MTIAEQLREEGKLQGIQQGIQQGVEAIAKKMLEEQVSLDVISRFTGLSAEHIEKLKH